MSFLDQYLTKYKLDALPKSVQNTINRLEASLREDIRASAGGSNFDFCIKEKAPQIADLVERLSAYMDSQPSTSILNKFKFVYNIGVEVHQIVNDMSHCVLKDSMTTEEKHKAKLEFGKKLVLLVWVTVDPLKNKFNWIPFKKTIERKLVLKLSNVALESVVDLFMAQGISPFSNDATVFVKGIPQII